MLATFAVFKREVALYFRSPIAYAVAFALLLFFGLLFSANVVQSVQFNGSQQGGQIPATQLNSSPGLMTFLMFLVAPLLTMRLIAEENREGTLETLMTLPISEGQFITGKFLAAWLYYTVLLALTGIHVWMLGWVGVPDYGLIAGSYLGAWLYGGGVLALTMIWSAVTEDQIVAAFLGAATVLVLYLSDTAALYVTNLDNTGTSGAINAIAGFFREIGLTVHYNAWMAQGIIRPQDVLYFLFLIVGSLFITTRIVETRRWRA